MAAPKFLSAIIIGCVFCLKLNGQIIDSVACKKVEDTLRIIENCLKDWNSDPHLIRLTAISFLKEISKIPYEGKVTFIGTEFPAQSFYAKCLEWYIAHKSRLIWDAKQEKILVTEKK